MVILIDVSKHATSFKTYTQGNYTYWYNVETILNSFHLFRYLSFGLLRNREMLRKILTMFQSVLKVENVCYNVKVRGSEAAIWSSSKACEKEIVDYDEGFIQY